MLKAGGCGNWDGGCVTVYHECTIYTIYPGVHGWLQDLYTEILSQSNFRERRFIELGRREGLPSHKLEQALDDGRVPSIDQCRSILPTCKSIELASIHLPQHRGQVPNVEFSFIDTTPKKGLTEDSVCRAKFQCHSYVYMIFASTWPDPD